MHRLWKLFLLVGLTACGAEHLAPAAHAPTPPGEQKVALTPGAALDWPLIQSGVLNACKNCHGKMADYAGVAAKLPKILQMTESGKMPPAAKGYAPLTACQQAVLQLWIERGAPETSAELIGPLPACTGPST